MGLLTSIVDKKFLLNQTGLCSQMPLRFLLILLFPLASGAQSFTHGRFVATHYAIFWTEKFEIKDMDAPVMEQTFRTQLSERQCVHFDSIQLPETVSGWLISPPSTSIAKAKFRIDILYESYTVTVSEITESTLLGEVPLEKSLLQKDGNFIQSFSKRLETWDEIFGLFFALRQ